jgi:hypothetical protein
MASMVGRIKVKCLTFGGKEVQKAGKVRLRPDTRQRYNPTRVGGENNETVDALWTAALADG